MKTALKYSAILIGGYLAVGYGTGWGELITKATDGSAHVIEAFQGRSK